MENNELEENIKMSMQNVLSLYKNTVECNKEFYSSLVNKYAETAKKWAIAIKNDNFPIPVSEEFKEYAQVVKESESLTEKEFERRFNIEYERNWELGEHGWIPSEHSNPRIIQMWYQYLNESPQKIMGFFEEDSCRVLNQIKNTLSGYYSERPYVLYYHNGIDAFDRNEYMTAAMYWTILLENRVANLVEFPEKIQGRRPTYAIKYSDKGFENQKNKTYANVGGFTKKRFLFLDVYPALIAYLNRLFAYGNLPLNLKKESGEEPDYLDRTWLLHGRCCRDVTREDCIQLLNALDVCEYALREKDSTEEDDN